ncbi:MAG: hypothetical protein JXR41_12960 [Bacteroidales bacterium]|nr:hypothetical protein [Bacteroidales bacterium]MBN2763997.1 hypothetical protein [Bacteroidales bacterium]
MNEKALRWIINIAGALCIYAFLAVRSEPLFNFVMLEKVIPEYWENTKYGELYYFNFIRHFREQGLPKHIQKYRHTEKHPNVRDADILMFGDSFLDFSRMVTFPERLSDSLHKKVYYERFFNDHRPLVYLDKYDYSNNTPKLVIYESTERYIPHRFNQPHETYYVQDSRSAIRKKIADVKDWFFSKGSEVKYNALLTRSIFSTHLYSAIATLKFDAFGYISPQTPVYSLNQKEPWLFYWEEVDSLSSQGYYYMHTEEEINTYCDNIADLRHKLKDMYNLDMVFLPIPSKYTIYHKLINNDPYNNFLPRLYEGLAHRGVPTIRLYDDYRNATEVLYYGTDTHWNIKGLDIALNKTLEYIKSLKVNNYFAFDSTHKTYKLN